jgi:hypothetical protein
MPFDSQEIRPSPRRPEQVTPKTPEALPNLEVVIPLFMNESSMRGLAGPTSPESTASLNNGREVFQALLKHCGNQFGLDYLMRMNLSIDFSRDIQSPTIRARYGINGEPNRKNHDVILTNAQELILAGRGQFGQPTDARSYSIKPDIRFLFPDSYRQHLTTEKILLPTSSSGLFKNILGSLVQYSNQIDGDKLPEQIKQTKIRVELVPNPTQGK